MILYSVGFIGPSETESAIAFEDQAGELESRRLHQDSELGITLRSWLWSKQRLAHISTGGYCKAATV